MNKIKPQSGFIKPNEVLLKVNQEWLHFANPNQIIIAEHLESVLPALQEIEKIIYAKGWYAAGFLSYEAASAFDPAFSTKSGTGFPYLWFGLYSEPRIVTLPQPEGTKPILDWQLTTDREIYNAAISKIKDYIAKGKTYQVNYTMRLQADFNSNPWNFFLHLIQNQDNHAAFLNTGQRVVCSASPELFFQLDGDLLTCRPMKGTARRGRTTIEDQEQATYLKNSEKNRAENVMIVDMIRNDLGKIARLGSVQVPHLFETERYSTLWQMTSTVTAKTNASLTEILTALFPCGSITGAPKVSTMKIIAGLEATPRKIYTGTIGYLSSQRKASFNVAIRTALIDKETQKAEYGIGGGIVWDSSGSDEYAESFLKGQILIREPLSFSLLETILWTPQQGYFFLEKHIARIVDSATYFDIPFTKEQIEEYLEQLSTFFCTPQRVRVLLDQEGKLSHESRFFELTKTNQTLQAHLASEPIDSRNVFLFHKTTRREMYDSARNGLDHYDDVLLYNEKDELTEFTIGNLVVELNGQMLTPSLSCGVLAGTFRAHLVETGQVQERRISVNQLKKCAKIFRVNSIRQWERVEVKA